MNLNLPKPQSGRNQFAMDRVYRISLVSATKPLSSILDCRSVFQNTMSLTDIGSASSVCEAALHGFFEPFIAIRRTGWKWADSAV